MKTKTTLLALALMGLAGTASAQLQGIYVERYDHQNPGDGWAPLDGFPDADSHEPGLDSGSDILIELTNSPTIRVYAHDPSTTDIGVITLKTAPGHAPTLIVGHTLLPQTSADAPLATPACRTLEGVRTSEQTRVQIRAHSISGPGIDAHRLVRLDLSGDLDAPVVHWGTGVTNPPALGAIEVAGDVTTNGSVAAFRGRVGPVRVDGDLNGSVVAKNGRIDFIEVGGSIGAEGRPAIACTAPMGTFAIDRIRAGWSIGRGGVLVDVVATGAVREIEADSIHALIDMESDATRPGFLASMTTRSGDFEGGLRARTLTSFGGWDLAPCAVSIAGDVRGDLIFTNGIRNESDNGPEIDIRGVVREESAIIAGAMFQSSASQSPAEIRVHPDGGLEGTIVVGKGQISDLPDQAVIRVGTQNPLMVTGANPYYSASFDSVGGGSVAVAPFNFHQTESFPNHNATITLESDEILTSVAPRFFGPVFALDLGMQHMIVEHLPEGGGSWVDRSHEFELAAPTDPALGSRTVVLSAIAPARFDAGQWRIRPADEALFCSLSLGNPEVKFDSEYEDDTYRFTVAGGSDCPQPRPLGRSTRNDIDFNDSDGITRVSCP